MNCNAMAAKKGNEGNVAMKGKAMRVNEALEQ